MDMALGIDHTLAIPNGHNSKLEGEEKFRLCLVTEKLKALAECCKSILQIHPANAA